MGIEDRIMFATDHPFGSMMEARLFLISLPISPADRELIAHKNAERDTNVISDAQLQRLPFNAELTALEADGQQYEERRAAFNERVRRYNATLSALIPSGTSFGSPSMRRLSRQFKRIAQVITFVCVHPGHTFSRGAKQRKNRGEASSPTEHSEF